MKLLSTAKQNYRRRLIVICGIFIPMVLAMILTAPKNANRPTNSMWKVRIVNLGPEIKSLLIIDLRIPNIRINCMKSQATDSVEVEMMLRSKPVGNALFDNSKPDISSIYVTARDQDDREQEYSLTYEQSRGPFWAWSNKPVVDVKLTPLVEKKD